VSQKGRTPPEPYGQQRRDERISLEEPLRRLTRLTLTGVGEAPGDRGPRMVNARLVDFSRFGFRFRAARGYDPGARLTCRLELVTVEAQSLDFDAEVRWCLRLGEGEYEGGARILGGAAESRLAVFERFLCYHRSSRSGGDP
jgi:hypothetical protein